MKPLAAILLLIVTTANLDPTPEMRDRPGDGFDPGSTWDNAFVRSE